MIEKSVKRSREHFLSGWYCAESVLLAISESKGINSELIPKIATGFGSGMSRQGGQCGAISGAIMGIGLITGRNSPEGSVEESYYLVQELCHRFQGRFGSTICRQLIGCDLSTEAGQEEFVRKNLIVTCAQYTEEATRIALSLMEERTNLKRNSR